MQPTAVEDDVGGRTGRRAFADAADGIDRGEGAYVEQAARDGGRAGVSAGGIGKHPGACACLGETGRAAVVTDEQSDGALTCVAAARRGRGAEV